jgi:hypothetical protein
MNGDEPAGVVFPASADGRRSTSALGRAVVAEALAQVDPAGSHGAEHEANWRTGYLAHFRRLIEAGLASRQDAVSVARDGLESLHRRMRVAGPGGAETGLDALVSAPAHGAITTVTVTGTGVAEGSLSVPYRGEALRGDALLRRLEAWVAAGVIEPSCADAVRMVAAHPDWLALPGRTIVVLGAGAEIGPLPVLLSWGARAIGIDLPRPFIWQRVLEMARRSAGTLLVPVAGGSADQAQPAASSAAPAEAISAAPEASGAARAASGDLAQGAGLDRALAAAYAGAHRFGVEVFDPATCKTLMAALLVHDLHTGGGPVQAQPWQDEAHAAAHGGLWRAAYAPRSALGLAALLGYPVSRGRTA